MLSLEDEEKSQITLVSNNKITEQRFTLSKKAASLSGFLKIVMKGDPDVSEINVDVEADILKKIVEYLVNHDGIPSNKIEPPLRTVNLDTIISPWDFTFIEEFDKDNLIKLLNASNYFNINCLLNLGCAKIAIQVKDKNSVEIKNLFNDVKI
jgi:hypothetical protein